MTLRLAFLLPFLGCAVACAAPDVTSTGSKLHGTNDTPITSGSEPDKNLDGSSTSTTKSSPVDGGGSSPSGPCAGGGTRQAQSGGLLTDQSITVWGDDRSYELEVPQNYDPTQAYPLVFVFHGNYGWPAQVRGDFNFASVASDKAFFVYPLGRNAEWDLTTPADQNEDMELFGQLTDSLSQTYCLDSSRVFSTGFSNGAYFSQQLGCRRGDKLRAIASHGGGGPYGPDEDYDVNGHMKCNGPSPAVLLVHGTLDAIVSPNNVKSSLDQWLFFNTCDSSTSSVSPSPCVTYDGCQRPVEKCVIPGLGHMLWSQGTQTTWNFFASF